MEGYTLETVHGLPSLEGCLFLYQASPMYEILGISFWIDTGIAYGYLTRLLGTHRLCPTDPLHLSPDNLYLVP